MEHRPCDPKVVHPSSHFLYTQPEALKWQSNDCRMWFCPTIGMRKRSPGLATMTIWISSFNLLLFGSWRYLPACIFKKVKRFFIKQRHGQYSMNIYLLQEVDWWRWQQRCDSFSLNMSNMTHVIQGKDTVFLFLTSDTIIVIIVNAVNLYYEIMHATASYNDTRY